MLFTLYNYLNLILLLFSSVIPFKFVRFKVLYIPLNLKNIYNQTCLCHNTDNFFYFNKIMR